MFNQGGRGPSMSGANQVPIGSYSPAAKKPPVSSGGSLLNPSYLQSFKSGGTLAPPTTQSSTNFTNWLPSSTPVKIEPPSSGYDGKRSSDAFDQNGGSDRKRKKKSRWATEDTKVNLAMPTVLPPNLPKEQEEAYLLQFQIEELTRRLRTGDLGIPVNPEERSPSPEPVYNHEGKRMNTREYRTRKKIEEDRHRHIVRMFEINKEYKPPTDYRPPLIKISDKVMIPQDDHPEINFIGLLIGPRGNTLKAMEKETGAKIIIRGKGSVKEGKVGRKDGNPLPGEDEPLHAYVTSSSAESVKKAVEKIKEVIRQGIEVPEGQNDLRRMQLRELALLNGTLREIDGPRCTNCGAATHKSWECPDKPNITHNVVCNACGGNGHIARDCRFRRVAPPGEPEQSKIDEEYSALMAELGEAPPKNNQAPQRFGAPMGNAYGYGRGMGNNAGPGGFRPRGPMPPQQHQHHQPAPPGMPRPWNVPPPGVPPPPPPGTDYRNPPPWANYGNQYASYLTPPPPPPAGGNQQQQQQQQQQHQPPHRHHQPPPPVESDNQPAMTTGQNQGWWGMQQQQQPPQQQHHHQQPVPPPQQQWGGYMGVPPPSMGQQGSVGSSRIDLNALAQAGLPNLLAAPPPPPPPPPQH